MSKHIVLSTQQNCNTFLPKSEKPEHWLKARISSFQVGMKVYPKFKDPHPIALNEKTEVADWLSKRRQYLEVNWTNKRFKQHELEEETFYFAGDSHISEETLFLIDVDVMKARQLGTPEGAVAFIEYITTKACQKKYGISFPNLFIDRSSTNGKGQHGFAIMVKGDRTPQEINQAYEKLESKLREIATTEDFNIEDVEIKGTLPLVSWGPEGAVVKFGDFAKLPRDFKVRFSELQNTTRIAPDDVESLPMAEKVQSRGGSCDHFKQATLDELKDGVFQRLAKHYTPKIQSSTKNKVGEEDVAIWLMVMEWMSENMNDGSEVIINGIPVKTIAGTLPVARIEGFWNCLFHDGQVSKAFNCHKFKDIRDFFSDMGLIEWEDSTYVVG